MPTLSNFISLLGVLVVLLPLLDRAFDPVAKRAIAEYLNPKLRPRSAGPPIKLVSPYDLATRVQRRIFDVRFLSTKFFLRSAIVTAFIALTIGTFDATISPVFRRLLLDAMNIHSAQFYFLVSIIVAALLSDYLCAGQTIFLLSIVAPTSRLLHLVVLLYANFCVSASIFAAVVGLSATLGAFVFDYRLHPTISGKIEISPIITFDPQALRADIDQTNQKVTWTVQTPSETTEWRQTAGAEQFSYSRLNQFSSELSNQISSSIQNVIDYETDPCSEKFASNLSNEVSINFDFDMQMRIQKQNELNIPEQHFGDHVDSWSKTANVEIKSAPLLAASDFLEIWALYSRDIGLIYIMIGQTGGLQLPSYISPVNFPRSVASGRCKLGYPINAGFDEFYGTVSGGGRRVTRYDVPLAPFLYAGIGVTVLVHATAILVVLGRYAGALGRLILPNFPGLTGQTERPFTVIAVTTGIYGLGACVVYMMVRMALGWS